MGWYKGRKLIRCRSMLCAVLWVSTSSRTKMETPLPVYPWAISMNSYSNNWAFFKCCVAESSYSVTWAFMSYVAEELLHHLYIRDVCRWRVTGSAAVFTPKQWSRPARTCHPLLWWGEEGKITGINHLNVWLQKRQTLWPYFLAAR